MPLQGSGYSSEPAREGDKKPETLPHMFAKDWMLNLDALEVRPLASQHACWLGKACQQQIAMIGSYARENVSLWALFSGKCGNITWTQHIASYMLRTGP